jgi:hypothetical protein
MAIVACCSTLCDYVLHIALVIAIIACFTTVSATMSVVLHTVLATMDRTAHLNNMGGVTLDSASALFTCCKVVSGVAC